MTSLPSAEPDVVTGPSLLAVVAGALTVALTAGSIVLGLADEVAPAAAGLAGAVFGVTGGVVAARRPRLVVGWMLLVVGLALTLASFCLDWARHSLVVDPGSLPAGELALWLGAWVWVVGYCVLAALLPLRLPDGAQPAGAWRLVWWAALAVSALAVAGWALTAYDQLDRPPLDGSTRPSPRRRVPLSARCCSRRRCRCWRCAPSRAWSRSCSAFVGRSARSDSRRSGSCGAPW